MARTKSRRTAPLSTASNHPPANTPPFKRRVLEEAKNYLAKWLVRGAFALAAAFVVLIIVLSFIIPGAHVAPGGVNWTFEGMDDPPVFLVHARVPRWFGLRYRYIPSLEGSARDAVNAYLAKHKPNCSIFSISPPDGVLVPCDEHSFSDGRNCFLQMPGGERVTFAGTWAGALVCK